MGRKKTNFGAPCAHCGEKPEYVKGLCKSCYSKQRNAEKKCLNPDDIKANIASAQNKIAVYADIVSMLAEGRTYQEVGNKYGVSRQRIWAIVNGLNRSHSHAKICVK